MNSWFTVLVVVGNAWNVVIEVGLIKVELIEVGLL